MQVYLDHAATTPQDPRVTQAMLPYFGQVFGNASSVHSWGQQAVHAIDRARDMVAACIGAHPTEIYFTAGGTEADNWAIMGVAHAYRHKGNHIVTSSIEHPAVREACRALQQQGYRVSLLPVDGRGVADMQALRSCVGPDTILVSLMHANNETGVIQPIAEAAAIAHGAGALFHTDAVQTAGVLPLEAGRMDIDLLSLSGHKFFGPKGVGALYVRRGVKPANLLWGGAQEKSWRGGTYNTPAIVGLGVALDCAVQTMADDAARVAAMRDDFEREVLALDGVQRNGDGPRVCGITNLHFVGVDGPALLYRLDQQGVAASAGSACAAGSVEPSPVLLAMGYSADYAAQCVRFSFGRDNTMDEAQYAAQVVRQAVLALRAH